MLHLKQLVFKNKNVYGLYRFFGNFLICAVLLSILMGAQTRAESKVTSPKEEFGANIGDDYHLINYTQLVAYWEKLEKESPRVRLEIMGETAEGREQIMAIVTSPQNFHMLEHYKEISRKLALAKNLTDEEAKMLAKEGKAIIWIDGGLHATEVTGAQQLTEMIYQMANLEDEETMRFLNDVILLLVPINPDGMELVSNWYMREPIKEKRVSRNIPRLYHKYIGHDTNRDYYMVNQPETENAARVLFREWFPQIMYNHHQSGPQDIFVFVPPFREPPNYNYDPLLILGNQAVGLAMHTRLVAEGKPGAGMRKYANYSTWYNGSVRTVSYFHNLIGMLTEMKGNPTPMELAFFPDRQIAANDFPMPHVPGKWHFRQSIDYSMTLNRAVLDYASRNREPLLFNRYIMGRSSIERGNRDSWTVHPRIVYEVEKKIMKDGRDNGQLNPTFRRKGKGVPKDYLEMFRKPENRDPRGFIIPSNQKDFPTAVKFLNTLVKNGITIHQAKSDFDVAGKSYPAGSYVVKAAQAFRPHILDMFEPQDHPDEFLYEGGSPVPPYDNAGWTLAFQMGVEFDRILEGFDGPFEEVDGFAKPLPGKVAHIKKAAGYLLSHDVVNSVIAVNRLLKSGHNVYWITNSLSANEKSYPAGTIYVEAKSSTAAQLDELAASLGLNIDAIRKLPKQSALQLSPARVALWDRYGGSMPSGWTRWLLEQYEFPYEVVYSKNLDAGDLDNNYDALVLVTNAMSLKRDYGDLRSRRDYGPDPETIPEEFRGWLGSITGEKTIPQLSKYLNSGGSIIAIGEAIALGYYLDLPISDHLVDARGEPLTPKEYYVPSSVLQVKVDNSQPIAYGIRERVDVVMDESPVIRLKPDAEKNGVTRIAWFDSSEPLRSGWAWGQNRLYGGTSIAEVKIGDGTLYLFGPEILFRGQPHGTFQFLFNGIYLATARQVQIGN